MLTGLLFLSRVFPFPSTTSALRRSVKAIYTGELGWFDGQSEDLYPMPYDEESTKTLLLMGGASKVLKAVEDAQAMNDHQWALKLIKIIRGAQAKDKSGGCAAWPIATGG